MSFEVVGRRGAETDVLGLEGRVLAAVMGGSSSDDRGVSFGLGWSFSTGIGFCTGSRGNALTHCNQGLVGHGVKHNGKIPPKYKRRQRDQEQPKHE